MNTFSLQSLFSEMGQSPAIVYSTTTQKLYLPAYSVWHNLLMTSKLGQTRAGWHTKSFLELVEQHFKEEHQPAFYASQLHLNRDYLRQACTKVLGVSPTHCINSRLVHEALPLIKQGKDTIEEIAFQLGFSSHSHFNHLFKKMTGLCPSAYRKK